jgi:protein TonB
MAAARFSLLPYRNASSGAPRDPGARYAGLAGAVLFHVVLIVALLQYAPVRRSIAHMAPIMVSVITPPLPETPPPPPKLMLARKPLPAEAPPPIAPPREPPPMVSEATSVSPITVASAPPPPQAVAESAIAPEPPPVIPPRFNADYLQNPAPAYPALARRMHEQGRVLIRVLVSADGLPERVELKTSSGFARLDHSALETIRGWKFVPARQGEQKVAAWVVVPITFTLDG